ncbi:MAG: FG-GAP repeat protein [Ahniella sp.]|nr:FG-GAP repeat protein [Ahniella sp.]
MAPTAAQSLFGASVAGVGDFNADGFSDILVGVPNASVGQNGEGAGLLFLGAPVPSIRSPMARSRAIRPALASVRPWPVPAT